MVKSFNSLGNVFFQRKGDFLRFLSFKAGAKLSTTFIIPFLLSRRELSTQKTKVSGASEKVIL